MSRMHFKKVANTRSGRWIASLWAGLTATLSIPSCKEEDLRSRDREIARNRLLLGSVSCAYAWAMLETGEINSTATIELNLVYLAISIISFMMTKYRWRAGFRRHLLLGVDVLIISAAFVLAGQLAAPLLFLYTWLTLGYGFRYGIYYLRLAALGSLCGLLFALLYTDYWQTQVFISSGWLMLGIVIPPYFELLLRRTIRANQVAADANHSKVLMLAGLGHRLRTPLGAILGASNVLPKAGLDLQQREALEAISTAARSLVRELDDFLDVSRIDAGRMRKEVTRFSLRQLLEDVIKVEGAQATAKGVAVSWYVSPDVPLYIWSERKCLARAISNIVENAVKFTSAGSVLITVKLHQTLTGNLNLRFEILDTGIGIQSDARQKIFESFTQATPEILHLFGGSGLGLSVACRMIRLLGGEIKVDSVEGKGSTFWFDLTLPRPEFADNKKLSLAGNAVIIISPQTESLLPFAAKIAKFDAKPHLSDHSEQWSVMIGDELEEIEHIVVIVDGRYGDASEIALGLRREGILNRVPMVLLHAGPTMPSPVVRRHFITAISATVSDRELVSALYLAGATGEKAMVKRDKEARHGDASSPIVSRRPMYVLVADSNRSSLAVISKVLEMAGHTSKMVDDSEQALDAFERDTFNLVLIDIDHPHMDGLETTKMVRFMQLSKRYTPIYGLTSREGPEIVTRCKDAGLDGILTQPIDPKELLKIVGQFLPEEVASPPPEVVESSVKMISSHPRFREGFGPPIKDVGFPYLPSIGGPSFVSEVIQIFVKDAASILAQLSANLRAGDVASFQTLLSSLRDSAGIIGAVRLVEICQSGGEMDQIKVEVQGRAFFTKLQREVDRVVVEVKSYSPAAS